MEEQDQIQRIVELPVNLERAWRAISTPEELSRWFSDEVAFEPQVGSEIIFDWEDYGRKYGQIEVIEAPYRFGFRWLAGDRGDRTTLQAANSTFVLMSLERTPSGTRLTVTETGFANLAPELRRTEFEGNTRGWETELGELSAYLA